MSKVWVKTQGEYEDYGICGNYVFGSMEAVNVDKMQYEHEATQFVQNCLKIVQERLIKTEAEKLPIRLSLKDMEAKLKRR